MIIGKVCSSSSHVEYICEVLGAGEAQEVPGPEDYGFGTFVGLAQRNGGHLVGVIANTTLMNPDFGNLGPRLSPQVDLAVFSPDYLVEKLTLVSARVIGAVDAKGFARQGVPPEAAEIDAPVRRLNEEEIRAFHRAERGIRLAYLPILLGATGDPLGPPLALELVDQLAALFPDERPRLSLLRANIAWRSRVQPLG